MQRIFYCIADFLNLSRNMHLGQIPNPIRPNVLSLSGAISRCVMRS